MRNPQEMDSTFMPGAENRAIRYWYYLNQGLNIINQGRNLILAILGLYIALKLESWWLIPAMFLPSLVLLTIVGYYFTHRVNKVTDFLNVRFGTHFALSQYDLQKENNELLKEILKKL